MSLSTKLILELTSTQTNPLDIEAGSSTLNISKQINLANGTSAGQATKKFSDRRTLSASASEDLDLAGGLTDAFGASLTFTKVKVLYVAAAAANSNNVIVGGAGANGFTTMFDDASDQFVLRPGAFILLAAGSADATGYAVTASTGDLLTIANSAGGSSVSYDIAIIGV